MEFPNYIPCTGERHQAGTIVRTTNAITGITDNNGLKIFFNRGFITCLIF